MARTQLVIDFVAPLVSSRKNVPTDIGTLVNVLYRTFFPTSALSESGFGNIPKGLCDDLHTLSFGRLKLPISPRVFYHNVWILSRGYAKISVEIQRVLLRDWLSSSG